MDAFAALEAAFITRMTASTTHELRNVLAVVKESAGLVEDLTRACPPHTPVNPEKLFKATQRIDAQVARAADLLTGLNRLAHGLDHREERLDLGQHALHVVFLCQRFARLRRQRIELDTGDGAQFARGNSLRLQMALTAAIDCCLEQLPDDAVIGVRVDGTADRPAVAFRATASAGTPLPAPDGAASWPHLCALATSVGASLEGGSEPFGFRLVVPADTMR